MVGSGGEGLAGRGPSASSPGRIDRSGGPSSFPGGPGDTVRRRARSIGRAAGGAGLVDTGRSGNPARRGSDRWSRLPGRVERALPARCTGPRTDRAGDGAERPQVAGPRPVRGWSARRFPLRAGDRRPPRGTAAPRTPRASRGVRAGPSTGIPHTAAETHPRHGRSPLPLAARGDAFGARPASAAGTLGRDLLRGGGGAPGLRGARSSGRSGSRPAGRRIPWTRR